MLFTIKKSLSVPVKDQKQFTGVGKSLTPFDPALSANSIAIYDGDLNLDLNVDWRDINNNNPIDFTASGTLPLTGGTLNGHNTIIFNGFDQLGQSTTPNIPQPYTVYLVARQITYPGFGFYLTDDGININQNSLITWLTNNEFILASGGFFGNPNFILNTFQVITYQINGANSLLRVDITNAINGDIGHNLACDGITLGAKVNTFANLNCEFAYIIMRNVADSTAVQNNFINWLKNRFAI